MATVSVIKLKVRRGTDNQRKLITLDEGELGYTTDTGRVFIGDSITPGGIPVSYTFAGSAALTVGASALVTLTLPAALTKTALVFVSIHDAMGAPGVPFVLNGINTSTNSFTISSTNINDRSIVSWMIVEPTSKIIYTYA